MSVVSLAPWLPASLTRKPHPALAAFEHIMHRVYPLPDDEPEGRLLAALTLLANAERVRDAGRAQAERLSEPAPSQPWWRRMAG